MVVDLFRFLETLQAILCAQVAPTPLQHFLVIDREIFA